MESASNKEMKIDVAAIAATDVSFVALKSARGSSTSDSSDVKVDCTNGMLVPNARFTPALLIAWGIAVLGNLEVFFCLGFTGAVKPRFVLPGHSNFQWSVVVAIFFIGGLVGSILAGLMGTAWARKRNLLITTALQVVSSLMVTFSVNIYMLMFARFLVGMNSGMTSSLVPLYIRELSTPNVRGTLVTGFQVAGTFGLFLCYISAFAFSGAYHDVFNPGWRMLALIPGLVAVVQLVLLRFLPESPSWLVYIDQMDQANDVLKKLRGESDVSIELEFIKHGLHQDKQNNQHKAEFLDVLRDRSIRRLLVIGCLIPATQQFCGIRAIMFYANNFFEDAGLKDPLVGTSLVGLVNFLATCAACFMMDRAGRRPLLIISTAGMAIAQIVVTLALLGLMPGSTVISVIGVLFSFTFYEFGVGPLAWAFASEILPPRPRAQGVSISMIIHNMSGFFVGLIFPVMQAHLGDFTFLPFAFINFFALLFVIKCVPETKNMTVEEIREDVWRRREAKLCACTKVD